MTTTQSIPLNLLVQSKTNVRRTGATIGIEMLMASIRNFGLTLPVSMRRRFYTAFMDAVALR